MLSTAENTGKKKILQLKSKPPAADLINPGTAGGSAIALDGSFADPPEKLYTLLSVEERRTQIIFKPDCLLLYNAGGRGNRDLVKEQEDLSAARKKRYTGDLSPSAQKNLVRGFDNLMTVSKRKPVFNRYIKTQVAFQLGMITLTLPNSRRFKSKEMNARLLKRFLQRIEDYSTLRLRKKLLYVWKLELQEKGQLHWHIIVNQFIPYELINKWWNYLLKDTGMTAEYYRSYSKHETPSARIESVRKNTATDMRNYMLKRYMRKRADKAVTKKMDQIRDENIKGNITEEDTRKQLNDLREICSIIDGSVWGCSDPLKEKYPTAEIDFATYMRLKDHYSNYPADFFFTEFCMIIRSDKKKPPDNLMSNKFKALIRAKKDLIDLGGSAALMNLN